MAIFGIHVNFRGSIVCPCCCMFVFLKPIYYGLMLVPTKQAKQQSTDHVSSEKPLVCPQGPHIELIKGW